MNSSWRSEIFAVFRKEVMTELRSRSGLTTGALFAFVTVVTIALATYNQRIEKNLAAALVWNAIMFSSILSLPRTFIGEEEAGTGDLLRLMARPHAVFWGKSLFNVVQALLTGIVLSVMFIIFTNIKLTVPWLYAVSLVFGCISLAGAVTICGALVCRANNRYALAAAVAVPILLPLISLGITGVRIGIGPFETDASFLGGVRAGYGLIGYAIATLVIGPPLYAAVWKS